MIDVGRCEGVDGVPLVSIGRNINSSHHQSNPVEGTSFLNVGVIMGSRIGQMDQMDGVFW